jgi:hypothetical protein
MKIKVLKFLKNRPFYKKNMHRLKQEVGIKTRAIAT